MGQVTGFFLIDKPAGITSHDVIDRLRKITGIKKIGHAGTLDPFATGLLIVAIGREYTKQIDKFLNLDKEYEAELILGKISTTYDRDGEIAQFSDKIPTNKEVQKAVASFEGKYLQKPPAFSAKKIKGKKAYELARADKKVDLPKQEVEIHEIELKNYEYPKLFIKTHVSKGTYVRSLADDIGQKLTTGAYLENLRRIKIGEYHIKDAIKLDDISSVEDLTSGNIRIN